VEANQFDDLYFMTGQKMCEHVECTPGSGKFSFANAASGTQASMTECLFVSPE
jgi:hypothetical protein